MAEQWYAWNRKTDHADGPFSAIQLRRMRKTGKLDPADFVREGEDGKWVLARLVTSRTPEGNTSRTPEGKMDWTVVGLIAMVVLGVLSVGFSVVTKKDQPAPSGYQHGIKGWERLDNLEFDGTGRRITDHDRQNLKEAIINFDNAQQDRRRGK